MHINRFFMIFMGFFVSIQTPVHAFEINPETFTTAYRYSKIGTAACAATFIVSWGITEYLGGVSKDTNRAKNNFKQKTNVIINKIGEPLTNTAFAAFILCGITATSLKIHFKCKNN